MPTIEQLRRFTRTSLHDVETPVSAPISVVIAAKDAEATIVEQLRALTNQAWPHGGEIIVADNGSNDATAEIAERLRSDVPVRVVDAGQLKGAGHARNVGVEHAKHGLIAFCDADDVVHDSWVVAIAEATSRTSAVGGRLDFEQLNPSWVVGSRGRLLASEQLPLFDGVFPVVSSCNLGIERTVFESLNGFNVSFVRAQDAELSLRLHQRGITPSFAPEAIVHYRMRGSAREIYRQARGWGEAQVALRQQLGSPSGRALERRTNARSWLWLGARLPQVTSRAGRARWSYVAGTRVGTASALRHAASCTPGQRTST